jgi:hypothetical protein
LQYSPLLLAESLSETSVADTTVAPVVGNPIERAGTVIPANALHFAAGVATAVFAGVVSLPPHPDTATADAANRVLTIAELRRLLNQVLILVSVFFTTEMNCSSRAFFLFSPLGW